MEKEQLRELIRENEIKMRSPQETPAGDKKNSWRLQERARKEREQTYADRNKGGSAGHGHSPISGPI